MEDPKPHQGTIMPSQGQGTMEDKTGPALPKPYLTAQLLQHHPPCHTSLPRECVCVRERMRERKRERKRERESTMRMRGMLFPCSVV